MNHLIALTSGLFLFGATQALAFPELTSHFDGDEVSGVQDVVVTNHLEPNWFARRTLFKTRNRTTGEVTKHCKVVQPFSQGNPSEFRCAVDFSSLPPGDYALVTITTLYGYGAAQGQPEVRHKQKAKITVVEGAGATFTFTLGNQPSTFYLDGATGWFRLLDIGVLDGIAFTAEFDVWADSVGVDTIPSSGALVDILEVEPGHFRVSHWARVRLPGESNDLVLLDLIGLTGIQGRSLSIPGFGCTNVDGAEEDYCSQP